MRIPSLLCRTHIDENGVKIDPKISDYYWVGSLLGNRKLHNVAAAADAAVISVEDPDSAWCNLLSALKKAVHNNFMPAFFMLGAAAMAMHYEAVLGKYGMCPTPVAIREKNMGKSTAVRACSAGSLGYSTILYSGLHSYSPKCTKMQKNILDRFRRSQRRRVQVSSLRPGRTHLLGTLRVVCEASHP